jgi:citronellyl-CoA dehydrogenase
MQYTHEHLEIQKTLKRFIDQEINPHVDEWEEAEIFPAHEVFKRLGDLGLLGLTKPEEFGGAGLDYSYSMAMTETLGHVECGGVPMAIGVQTDMATPALARYGSDELRRQFLAPAIAGEMVACVGVSEPGAGSDVAGIKARAVKDGDDYVITGQKMWITNSLQADWMCMLVNTGEGDSEARANPHKNKSLVIVPLRDGPNGKLTKGIEVAKKIRKIGMNSSDTGLIYFDEVRVPQRYRIGAEGQGFIYQMQQFQEERLWAAANCLVSLTNCIEWTIEWAHERKLFGSTLADQQWVQFKLAELKTEVESLRALTYRACDLYVQGQDVLELASMAKLKAGRLNRLVPDTCLQFWGGMGYTWENKVSRMYRDGRLASIGGGADEVMLQILARIMGVAKRSPSPSGKGQG